MEVYTDGSCFYKTKQGGWAFCIIKDDSKIFEHSFKETDTTISRMGVTAAIKALEWIKNNQSDIPDTVRIYSDSQYLVKTMTEGWDKFRNNHDLWLQLDELVETISVPVDFIWVRGHDKNYWNEYVDGLASYKRVE